MLEKPKKFLRTLHHYSQTRNKKVYSSLDYTCIINAFFTVSHTSSLLMLIYYRYMSIDTKLITLPTYCTESETVSLYFTTYIHTYQEQFQIQV